MAHKIFITGGSGYIGSVVTEFALADGYKVRALSRTEESDEKIRKLGATPVRGDLTTHDVLRTESADADIIIHLATAYRIGSGPYESVLPIDNAAVDAFADSLAGTGKPFLVTSGTLMAAADPTGAETDEMSPPEPHPINTRIKNINHALSMTTRNIRVICIRLAPYVYGRGGSGVKMFMGMSKQAGKVTCVDGGKNHTTVVHVDDAARLYLLAAEKANAGDTFNASGATNFTARQIFDAIATAIGVSVESLSYEDAVAKLDMFFAWFLRAENRASGAKAVRELGWQPKGMGILDEISKGSYVELAKALKGSD
ncbi:Fc.00g009760.m01.CDS01 [Cosmosporella sp. VM-42]